MPFDYKGARQAGYSDEEIAGHLGKEHKFDVSGALQSGYSAQDIIKHLTEDTRGAGGRRERDTLGGPARGSRLTPEAEQYRVLPLSGSPGVIEQTLGGAKHAWDRAAMGLKGMVTDLSPEDQALLARGKAFVDETGPASTVGQIGGDIAMTAAPITRGYNAVMGAARHTPQLLRRTLAATVPAAATEAVIAPEDRATAAAVGAAGGAGGEVVGKVLKQTMAGLVKPSVHAERLMAQGIQPTIGQGAKSSMVHGTEDLVAGLPIVGQIVRKGQQRAIKEAENEFLLHGTPLAEVRADLIAKLGRQPTTREEISALGDAVTDAYTTVLKNVPEREVTSKFRVGLEQIRNTLPPSVRNDFEEVLRPYTEGNKLTGTQLHQMTKDLGELAQDYLTSERGSDKRLGRSLQAVQGKLKQAFFGNSLDQVDDAYRNLVRIQRAGSYGGTAEGIKPSHMERAVRRESGPVTFAEGRATLQELSDPAQILKESPNSGMSTLSSGAAAALAHILSGGAGVPAAVAAAMAAGSYRPVAKAAFGGYARQKQIADYLRGHRGFGPAGGAALTEEEE